MENEHTRKIFLAVYRSPTTNHRLPNFNRQIPVNFAAQQLDVMANLNVYATAPGRVQSGARMLDNGVNSLFELGDEGAPRRIGQKTAAFAARSFGVIEISLPDDAFVQQSSHQ